MLEEGFTLFSQFTLKVNIGWIGLTQVVANRRPMGLPYLHEGLIGLSGNGVDD